MHVFFQLSFRQVAASMGPRIGTRTSNARYMSAHARRGEGARGHEEANAGACALIKAKCCNIIGRDIL